MQKEELIKGSLTSLWFSHFRKALRRRKTKGRTAKERSKVKRNRKNTDCNTTLSHSHRTRHTHCAAGSSLLQSGPHPRCLCSKNERLLCVIAIHFEFPRKRSEVLKIYRGSCSGKEVSVRVMFSVHFCNLARFLTEEQNESAPSCKCRRS